MNSKINLLIPLAGNASRFLKENITIPKPLIHAKDKMIIEWATKHFNLDNVNLIFVVKSSHISNFQIDEVLKQKFGNDIKIVVAEHDTGGSVESCLLAINEINNDNPLVTWCSDLYFETKNEDKKFDFYRDIPKDLDGFLLTFKSNNPAYSYCKLNQNGYVEKVAEKLVISSNANAGLYYFKTGNLFLKYAKRMIEMNDKSVNEFFLAPLYNHLIKEGLKVGIGEVEKVHIMGTPNELNFFVNVVLNKFGSKECVVGLSSDHSGYLKKQVLKKILDDFKIKYIDFGNYSLKSADYVDYSVLIARAMKEKTITHGILLCKSGQGQNIFINKFKHVRSALIWNSEIAKLSIEHNGANCFCIPSDFVSDDELTCIVDVLSKSDFFGGRHQSRVQKVFEGKYD